MTAKSIAHDKPSVLIVDDDPAIAELVVELLADSFNVTCFHNPIEALQLAEKALPDIALLDVMMPGMNGLTMVNRLRTLPGGDKITIYIMTAHHGLQPEIAKADINGFFPKPFDPDDLVRRLSKVGQRV